MNAFLGLINVAHTDAQFLLLISSLSVYSRRNFSAGASTSSVGFAVKQIKLAVAIDSYNINGGMCLGGRKDGEAKTSKFFDRDRFTEIAKGVPVVNHAVFLHSAAHAQAPVEHI